MQAKIEGIILNKTLWRERDLIVSMLLRNGKKISVVFYGGAGGKKPKSKVIEWGHLLAVELKKSAKASQSLWNASEYSLKWSPMLIRENHQAFYLMCFYLEMAQKLAVEVSHEQNEDFFESEYSGLFRVLSNGLFYLEDALKKNKLDIASHYFLFVAKLCFELGVSPHLQECFFCHGKLSLAESLQLSNKDGGIVCDQCQDKTQDERRVYAGQGKMLWQGLVWSWQSRYDQYESLKIESLAQAHGLLDYLLYQFHLSPTDIKSHQMLGKS